MTHSMSLPLAAAFLCATAHASAGPTATEVAYVLAPSLSHQTAALSWLQRGVDAGFVRCMGMNDLARVSTLLAKYRHLPADFADVSLVWLAQQKRFDKVVTIDERDFALYRSYAGRSFKNIFL